MVQLKEWLNTPGPRRIQVASTAVGSRNRISKFPSISLIYCNMQWKLVVNVIHLLVLYHFLMQNFTENPYIILSGKKIFFFEKIVKVSSKNFKNSKKFFFANRVQNRLKRRQNQFGRKKIFFKKSSVSTTSILGKNFKNRKIFFSCIVFRMV